MSSGGDCSVTFNPAEYRKSIEVTLYSDRISIPIDVSEVDLQEVLVRCTTSLLEFKASDLTEKIKANNQEAINKIAQLKRELELLENTNQ
jgi:hypothetical protein